ncbi:MAG: sensor domain-containing diguanylate cyclase [Solirubrobacteraceae bacterium]
MRGEDPDAIIDVAAGLLTSGTPVATLDAAATRLAALLPYDDVTVYAPNPDGRTYRALHAVGRWVPQVMAELAVDLAEGVTGRVLADHRARLVPDARLEPASSFVDGTGDPAESLVSVPLLATGGCLGVLNVYRAGVDRPFSAREATTIKRLGRLTAVALGVAQEREALRREARTDALTGALNRRGLAERLEALVAAGRAFAVVLLDLDHFKAVNDRHGHAEGDRVLAEAARALATTLRRDDAVARFGGEEFAILMPDARAEELLERVTRLRAAVASVRVAGAPVRCSAGVAGWPEHSDVLRAADAALYSAKRGGRDRACAA